MKSASISRTLCILTIVLSLAGCNYPGAFPAAQDTPTPLPPTSTSPPPTEPPTPIPPTEAPTLPPVTPTTVPPTPVPPTPTMRPSPTPQAIKPLPGAKYDGTFEGGKLTFRTNPTGFMVVPKTIRVDKANCQEGKKLSDTMVFEPPTYYKVEDGKFTISWDTQLYMTGVFLTSSEARGSLELKFKKEGVACTIGPVVWVARAVE